MLPERRKESLIQGFGSGDTSVDDGLLGEDLGSVLMVSGLGVSTSSFSFGLLVSAVLEGRYKS